MGPIANAERARTGRAAGEALSFRYAPLPALLALGVGMLLWMDAGAASAQVSDDVLSVALDKRVTIERAGEHPLTGWLRKFTATSVVLELEGGTLLAVNRREIRRVRLVRAPPPDRATAPGPDPARRQDPSRAPPAPSARRHVAAGSSGPGPDGPDDIHENPPGSRPPSPVPPPDPDPGYDRGRPGERYERPPDEPSPPLPGDATSREGAAPAPGQTKFSSTGGNRSSRVHRLLTKIFLGTGAPCVLVGGVMIGVGAYLIVTREYETPFGTEIDYQRHAAGLAISILGPPMLLYGIAGVIVGAIQYKKVRAIERKSRRQSPVDPWHEQRLARQLTWGLPPAAGVAGWRARF